MKRLLIIGLLMFLTTGSAFARTWYVKPDSTGDAPTIHAGLDSASYGDTVLVAPGTYVRTDDPETWINPGPGVALVGEEGPETTVIELCNSTCGIGLGQCEGASVSGFTLRMSDEPGCDPSMGWPTGIFVYNCTDVVVENCIIESFDYGIWVEGESLEWWKPVFRNNTIRGCSYGISCSDGWEPSRPLFEGNIITHCGRGAAMWDSKPNFVSCEIIYSYVYGLAYWGHCGGNVNKCVIAHTNGDGVYISSDPALAAPCFNGSWLHENANDFYDNAGWDIWYKYASGQGLVMAPYNYWGSDCPDFAAKIYGGVIFRPWMDSTHTLVFDEDDCPDATEPTTWGGIKAIYR